MLTHIKRVANWCLSHPVVTASVGVATGSLSFGAALAGATGPTYDITPVVTSVQSELVANLPVILGVVGALIALAIAVRAVRKFAKV
jgi:cell division protein FtsX